MGSIKQTIAGVMVALAATGSGCNLEAALGVDGDGSTTSDSPPTSGSAATAADSTAGTDAPGSSEDGTQGVADSSGTGPMPSSCGGRTVRVATYNIEGVGAPGSASFEAVVDVLTRIDADIVCMEEVHEDETAALFALGNAAGYPDVIQANPSPAIGGELTNACLGRPGLTLVGSWSGDDLSPDAQANDVGRDILVVRAELAGPGDPPCSLGLVALHLKSGQAQLDWYRRQVEAQRVVQAVARYRELHPDDPMVIMGDFNENLGDPAIGYVFDQAPVGLPDSYQTGSDIAFPLTYDPFATFVALGFAITDATQEDSDRDETWADLVRLDYVLHEQAQPLEAEVYNACLDNGVDDAPAGGSMTKAGDPLDCSVSEVASDHFPVFVDLSLP